MTNRLCAFLARDLAWETHQSYSKTVGVAISVCGPQIQNAGAGHFEFTLKGRARASSMTRAIRA